MNEPPIEVEGRNPLFGANPVARKTDRLPSTSPTQTEIYYKCATIVPYQTMKEMVTVVVKGSVLQRKLMPIIHFFLDHK